ncbi:hypothetical protein [Sphingomonas morindae]|uniref:Uncharacterized protein n=1 Tax=Sphingomonas morindae TaxID=1541170 RepID=A0ABY4XAH8_9SPHN|nr:hypothetical protein [Sphingomonas morindae]USI73878.1 hypothetical protein LHA26_05260 [Sphingomonas morindae]
MTNDASGRERDYRMVRAAMALIAGGDDAPGDPDVVVIVGREIRDISQTKVLLEMLAAQKKGCIYIAMPPLGATSRAPQVHVIRWTGLPDARFDVTGRCAFWAPDEDGRLLITSQGGRRGHFEMIDGRLVHQEGPPPGPLGAGIARAARRLRTKMSSLRDVTEGLEQMPSRRIESIDDFRRSFEV